LESKYKVILFLAIIILIGFLVFNSLSPNIADDFGLEKATDGGKKIVNYTGDGGDIIIPDELGITEIGDDAFRNSNITSIKSNTVKKIGTWSFDDCTNLKTVDFPNTTTIGSYAFVSCSNLESVNFPKLKTIGDHAFLFCEKLTKFLGNPNITSIGYNAFAAEQEGSKVKQVPIPLDIKKYLGYEAVWIDTSHYGEPYFDDKDYLFTSGNTMYYSQKRTPYIEEGHYEYVKI